MAHVRGRDLQDAVDFVHEHYGPEGGDRVLAALDPETRSTLSGAIRAVDWYPLDALLEYLGAACRILAAGSVDFCRQQGRFAAARQKADLLAPMVGSRETRARMAPTTWRMFYDVGSLEVVGDSPQTAVGRIHDFPATAESCARFLGIWEGIASTPDLRAIAEETRCRRRGDGFCEISLRYEPA